MMVLLPLPAVKTIELPVTVAPAVKPFVLVPELPLMETSPLVMEAAPKVSPLVPLPSVAYTPLLMVPFTATVVALLPVLDAWRCR